MLTFCSDKGSEVGPTMKASILNQFGRLRDADRFWFENTDYFTPEEIEMIHGTKLVVRVFFFFAAVGACESNLLLGFDHS